MVKVSVIIPVYNVEQYLEECLDSILNQEFRDYEVICVDDCSDDGSVEILNEYKEKYKKLKLLCNEEKQGAAISRNKGLEHATGKYVVFLDSDDYFDNTLLNVCYKEMENKSLDLLLYDCVRVDRTGKIVGNIPGMSVSERKLYEIFNYYDIRDRVPLKKFSIIPWNRMVRRQFLIDKNIVFQDLPSNNDIYFGYITIFFAERIGLLLDCKPLVYYRCERNGQLTANRNAINYYMAIKLLKEKLSAQEKWDLTKQQILQVTFAVALKRELEKCSVERKKQFWEYFKKNALIDYGEEFCFPVDNFLYKIFCSYYEYQELSYFWKCDEMCLYEMVVYGENVIKYLKESACKKVAIWGLGNRGRVLYLYLVYNNIFADYYIDKNVEKVDKDFFREVTIQGTLQEPVDIIVATNEYIYNDLKADKKYRDTEIVLLDSFFISK